MWYTQSGLCFLAWMSMKWLQKLVPLSDSVLSGVLHHMLKVFWVVALVTGYDSNHIVVTSTTASLWCFHQHIHGSVIYLTCQAFPFWYLNHCLMFSWAHQAMSKFPLCSQSRSTWSSSISSSLVYLLLVLMFSSGIVLRHMSICVTDLYKKTLHSGSNILLKHSGLNAMWPMPVLPVGSMNPCRGKALATFLVQWYLKATG